MSYNYDKAVPYQGAAAKNAAGNKPAGVSFRGGKFERTPESDGFYSAQKEKRRKNIIKAAGALALAAAAAYFAFRAGKNASAQELSKAVSQNQGNERTIQELQNAVNSARQKLSETVSQNQDNEKTIRGMQEVIISAAQDAAQKNTAQSEMLKNHEQLQQQLEQLEDALKLLPENSPASARVREEFTRQIQALLQNPKLNYDPLAAPIEKISSLNSGSKIFKISEIPAFTPAAASDKGLLQIPELKSHFAKNGSLTIELPALKNGQKPAECSSAAIAGRQIQDLPLGRTVQTNINLEYGKRTNWSSRKIARDIMQNFYDGNGNTLDGAAIFLEKQKDGTIKIKISGLGEYDFESLRIFGSGKKSENPYNAGGFGEGSKILAANLLGQKYTSAVSYSCADWRYTLSAPETGNRMLETLSRTDKIKGNTIEFTTDNQELADAIIESANFFSHSKNPDFQGLTFDSPDFGFKILGGGKKGNLYLTQRFELEGCETWDKPAGAMDIIFKRKPDAKKFKWITKAEFPQDRDRTALSFEDIEHLTHYFANNMTDKEIMQSILSTKAMWGLDEYLPSADGGRSALKSFLKGMIAEASSSKRNLALDIQGERFVSLSGYENQTVMETLSSYGYKFLPAEFSKIGIETASSAFRKLSVHKPLQPSEIEIKKLTILEKGLDIVQQCIQQALKAHLKKADMQIIPEHCERNIWLNSLISLLAEKDKALGRFRGKDIQNMKKEDFAQLCAQLSAAVSKQLKASSEKPDPGFILDLSGYLLRLNDGALSVKSKNYASALKDYCLITAEDVKKPKYIFDRHEEIAKGTLGEAIIDCSRLNSEYKGHWVDREYLNTSDFYELLGTWIHECCHKSGGDGSSDFTYALTDMLRVLLPGTGSGLASVKLGALADVFNNLK